MTAELSNDCSTITIESNLFNATNTSNVLTLVHSGTTYTIAITSDTLRSADSYTKLRVRYSSATLTKIGTTEWLLVGDLSA